MRGIKYFVFILFLFCLGFAGCQGSGDPYSHVFEARWTSDETNHWKKCTDSACVVVGQKAAHTWDSGVVTKEPFYEANGVIVYTCTTCGRKKEGQVSGMWTSDGTDHWKVLPDGITSNKAAHTWDSGVVIKEPSAGEEGVKIYVCTTCGKKKEGPASGMWTSDETDHWKALPDGIASNKAAHIWDCGVVTKEPFGGEKDIVTYTCAVCGRTKTESGKVSYLWKSDEDFHWHQCSNPGCTLLQKLKQKHSWGLGKPGKETDSEGKVLVTYTCVDCGRSYEKFLDFNVNMDSDYHWEELAGIRQEATVAKHTWGSGLIVKSIGNTADVKFTCTACGFPKVESNVLYEWGSNETNHWKKAMGVINPATNKPHEWDSGNIEYDGEVSPNYATMIYKCFICSRTKSIENLMAIWNFNETNHWREVNGNKLTVTYGAHDWGPRTADYDSGVDGNVTYNCVKCLKKRKDTSAAVWKFNDVKHWKEVKDIMVDKTIANHKFITDFTIKEISGNDIASVIYKCVDCGFENYKTIPLTYAFDDSYHWKTIAGSDNKYIVSKEKHKWDFGQAKTVSGSTGTVLYTCTVCKKTKDEGASVIGWRYDFDKHWKLLESAHSSNIPFTKESHVWGKGRGELINGLICVNYKCDECSKIKTVYSDAERKSNETNHWLEVLGNKIAVSDKPHTWEYKSADYVSGENGTVTYLCTECSRTKEEQKLASRKTDANNHWWDVDGNKVKVMTHNWNSPSVKIVDLGEGKVSKILSFICADCQYEKFEECVSSILYDETYHWTAVKDRPTLLLTDKTKHNWTNWKLPNENLAAAKTATLSRYCTLCNKKETKVESISFVPRGEKYKTYHYRICGNIRVPGSEESHKWVRTFISSGWYNTFAYECSDCGYYVSKTFPLGWPNVPDNPGIPGWN